MRRQLSSQISPTLQLPSLTYLHAGLRRRACGASHGQRKTQGPRIRFHRINDRRQLGTGRLRPRTRAVLQRRDNTAPAPANKGKAPAPPALPPPPPPTEGPTEGASTSLHPLFKRVGFAPNAKVPSRSPRRTTATPPFTWLKPYARWRGWVAATRSHGCCGFAEHPRQRQALSATLTRTTARATFARTPARLSPSPPPSSTSCRPTQAHTGPHHTAAPHHRNRTRLAPRADDPRLAVPACERAGTLSAPVSMSPPTTILTLLPAPPAAVRSAPPPQLCPRSRTPACTPTCSCSRSPPALADPATPLFTGFGSPHSIPSLSLSHAPPFALATTAKAPPTPEPFVRGTPSPSPFALPPSPTSFLAPAAAAARPGRPPPRPSLPASAPRMPSPAAGSPDTRAVRAQRSAPSPSPFASSPSPVSFPVPAAAAACPPAPLCRRRLPARRPQPQAPPTPEPSMWGVPPPSPASFPMPAATAARPPIPPLPLAHAPSALEHDNGDGELLSAPSSLQPNSLFSDQGPPAPGAHKHRAAQGVFRCWDCLR
ncbi:hypothetical protein B0H14DRAFT_3433499 [Mycena olivaceomarginata]|nr:hypothetical protein B0H14DRAFT_3433499 [Mycena olivaceomarginata]